MEPMPLLRFLVEAGLGARRQVVSAIKQGRVSVNGRVVESYTMPVYPQWDTVSCDGKAVSITQTARIVLMLNKPAGYLTTTAEDKQRKTVMDLVPPVYRVHGLHPVGRLDAETTGLLLLTNDGILTYRLTHPKFEHEKEYVVQMEGRLSPEEKEKLEKGILLEDGMTSPAAIKEINDSPPFNYSITIHEGRHRQVRRMFLDLGHDIKALKRTRMGGLELGDLEVGGLRQLSGMEMSRLMQRGKQRR